jgi:hypothetical protein
MLKEASFITDWIEEGEARGEARGHLQEARRFLLQQLAARFGELPAPVVTRVEQADTAACEEWGLRLMRATTLEDLGLLEG